MSRMQGMLPLALLGILTALPGSSQAQVNSNSASVTLNATVADYIAINASPANVAFNLVPGTGPTAGAPSLNLNCIWSLSGGPTMSIWAFFSNAASALTDGSGNDIPSANVFADLNGSGPQAFTATGPFGGAGAGLRLMQLPAAASGNQNDTLDLSIDLTTQPTLPAGTYTGILNIQGQAI